MKINHQKELTILQRKQVEKRIGWIESESDQWLVERVGNRDSVQGVR